MKYIVWAYKTRLTPPRFIEEPETNQEVSDGVFVRYGYFSTFYCSSIRFWNRSDIFFLHFIDNLNIRADLKIFYLLFFNFIVFNATFSNISAILWRLVLVVEEAGVLGENPPTIGKQQVNIITCGCESSAPFL